MIISHGGDFGDTIYALSTVKTLAEPGKVKLRLHPANVREPYNPAKVERMRELLEKQPYIESVEFGDKPAGLNLDHWRARYRSGYNISDMVADAFGVEHYPRDEPWLFCDQPVHVADVIIHRSLRYHNPSFDWKKVRYRYSRKAVFVGTPDEYTAFHDKFGAIPYHQTSTLYELAQVISAAKTFVGNQSAPMSIAIGLAKTRIVQEQDLSTANCHWNRIGATYNTDYLPSLSLSALRDACSRSLIPSWRLDVIGEHVEAVAGLEGALAECGCFNGGSAFAIASQAPGKLLHLFDALGLPEDGGDHRKGEFAAQESEVRAFLAGKNVAFHYGVFPQTAAGLDQEKFSFLHLDFDLYGSTKAALDWFWPRLMDGGRIVLDDVDWPACPGVMQALEDTGLMTRLIRVSDHQGLLIK